jgi:methyl-accepting chemotaxis protein
VRLDIFVHLVNENETTKALRELSGKLDRVLAQGEQILMNDSELKALLDQIDTATNHIGSNVQTIADTSQTISDEVDALVTAQQNAGVSSEIIARTKAIADRMQQVSDAGDSQVTLLKAIAAKGKPTVPDLPPPVTIPATTVA